MKTTLQTLAENWLESGSDADFNKLYLELNSRLQTHVYKLIKDADDRNEVISKTFEKILRKRHQYNNQWNFNTWAYKIATNEALLSFRSKKNTVPLDAYNTERLITEETVNTDNELAEVYRSAVDAIQRLPDRYRDVMELYVNGVIYEEIAEELEIPLNTVRTRIRRGKELIKEELLSVNPNIESILR